jgi:L-2,4-diaminobutyrate transaminase
MVMDRAPDHMSRVYFGLGGSDANETNVKLVWYYNNILGRPEKKKIISRWRGYHGSGLMSGSLTGLSMFHKKFDLPLDTVRHTTAPYYSGARTRTQTEAEFTAQCAADLEALIEAKAPTPSPPSSRSRCWARAASCPRPRATGRPSSRSCASTTSC